MDMLMCRGGQWWICSGAGVVNCVYGQVQWWSMVDMLMYRSDQLSICSCAVVLNGEYAHVEWWLMDMLMCSSCQLSMMDTLMCTGGQ